MVAATVEVRRRAVVAALRAVTDEPPAARVVTLRLDEITRQVGDILRRLDALEEQVGASADVDGDDDGDADDPGPPAPPVPPFTLPTGGMSPRASQALFGD